MKQPHRATLGGRALGWLVTAVVAAGATGLVAGPALAAPNQYATSIGTAVGRPLTGPAATAPTIVTSAACPAGTTAINAFLNSTAANIVDAVAIAGNTADIGTVNTTGVGLSFTLPDIAAANPAGPRTLVNGSYELSIVCLPDLFGSPGLGQFDATFTVSGGATATSPGTTYTFASPVVSTTTTIAASPATSAQTGAPVTLTATVSPAGATGTVQFKDSATGTAVNVGSPATVSGGTASISVSTLATGSHSFTAVYAPADPTKFATSTSSALAYTITAAPATTTTTSLAVSPASTAVAGAPVALTATVSPATATGTVQFEDTVSGSAVAVGPPATVTNGTATLSTTSLTTGGHTLRARFVPANSATFAASTSAGVPYTITPPVTPPTTTTTTIAASPAGAANQGAPVTLTATVSPATAVGSVQFQDVASGTPVNVGNATAVSGGTATVSVSTLSVGGHTLQAVFTPTNAASFTTSTSATLAYTVNAVVTPPTATTATLAASPANTAAQGATVTLTATLAPAAATGTVQFRDTVGATTSNLGTPVTVTGGAATFSTSTLAVGQHSFTAVFTPTDPAAFTASTSTPVPYTVTAVVQPPATTTTTVTASPAGTAVEGAAVTFTASVAPAAAGTVQFSDTAGGTPVALGAPVTVSGGSASVTTSALAVGTHQVVAAFTPADAAAFAASASAPLAFTVSAASGGGQAEPTRIRLRAEKEFFGRDRHSHGHDEFLADDACTGWGAELSARVRPREAAGTVQFFDTVDGTTTPVGGPVTVERGRAETVACPLAAGTHVFTAVFVPADPAAYQGSTSDEAPVKIRARRSGM